MVVPLTMYVQKVDSDTIMRFRFDHPCGPFKAHWQYSMLGEDLCSRCWLYVVLASTLCLVLDGNGKPSPIVGIPECLQDWAPAHARTITQMSKSGWIED
jgi:hypothetical protein